MRASRLLKSCSQPIASGLGSRPCSLQAARAQTASSSTPQMGRSDAAKQVDFLMLAGKLKNVKRAGWVQRGIPDCESVADHMYRMALMSMVLQEHGINPSRCLQLAVVHDLAEAIVGDITPDDGVSKEEKNRRETAAINEMTGLLHGALGGPEVKQLWQEYEDCSTPEAALVKDYDKLEMILQAHEYQDSRDANLEEFFQSVKGKFKTETGRRVAEEIEQRRRQNSS